MPISRKDPIRVLDRDGSLLFDEFAILYGQVHVQLVGGIALW